MKLILSRKGFDSGAGKVPSPVFPDGRMVSLPIPDKQSPITYEDISWDGKSIAPLVSDLTRGKIPPHYLAHLDPDLNKESLPREKCWKPLLGQTGAPQGHLRKNNIKPGDIFLFYGLFRRLAGADGNYVWEKHAPRIHVVWGWLQIAEIISLPDGNLSKENAARLQWAKYHPHFHRAFDANNTLYIASDHLTISDRTYEDIKGAGVFTHYNDSRRLTAHDAEGPSIWRLPSWFYPTERRTPLTFHQDLKRWQKIDDHAHLKTAARGQEFVLNADEYPEAISWIVEMLKGAGKNL